MEFQIKYSIVNSKTFGVFKRVINQLFTMCSDWSRSLIAVIRRHYHWTIFTLFSERGKWIGRIFFKSCIFISMFQ